MQLRLHTVYIRRYDHMYQRCLGSGGYLCSRLGISAAASLQSVSSAAEPVRPATAASARDWSRAVHCICTDCRQRSVHGDAPLQQLYGDSDVQLRLHTVYIRRYDHMHERCLGSGGFLCSRLIISAATEPVRPAPAASARDWVRAVHCSCTDSCQRSVHCHSSLRSL